MCRHTCSCINVVGTNGAIVLTCMCATVKFRPYIHAAF